MRGRASGSVSVVGEDPFGALIEETDPLARQFAKSGKRLYLVGGIVRDTLRGFVRTELDIDLTTDAEPDEIEAILRSCKPKAVWTQGKRFGTIGASIVGPNGVREFEVTTHRAELYHDDSRKPEVRFSADIELDLSRRDFTVNAMAYDLHQFVLLDPFGGKDDLARSILRTPLSPEISFRDDPLRMLRAARFLASLDMVVDSTLRSSVREHGHRMSIVSSERITGELRKLLHVIDPTKGIKFLIQTGLTSYFLPELSAGETQDIAARVLALENIWETRFAGLLWDAEITVDLAKDRMSALKFPGDQITLIAKLLHLKSVDLREACSSDAGTRRFLYVAGSSAQQFLSLVSSDANVKQQSADRLGAIDRLAVLELLHGRIASLRTTESLVDFHSELDGSDVMAVLGIAAGREVGAALDMLLSLRLEVGIVGRNQAEHRLRLWWNERHRGDGLDTPEVVAVGGHEP